MTEQSARTRNFVLLMRYTQAVGVFEVQRRRYEKKEGASDKTLCVALRVLLKTLEELIADQSSGTGAADQGWVALRDYWKALFANYADTDDAAGEEPGVDSASQEDNDLQRQRNLHHAVLARRAEREEEELKRKRDLLNEYTALREKTLRTIQEGLDEFLTPDQQALFGFSVDIEPFTGDPSSGEHVLIHFLWQGKRVEWDVLRMVRIPHEMHLAVIEPYNDAEWGVRVYPNIIVRQLLYFPVHSQRVFNFLLDYLDSWNILQECGHAVLKESTACVVCTNIEELKESI